MSPGLADLTIKIITDQVVSSHYLEPWTKTPSK